MTGTLIDGLVGEEVRAVRGLHRLIRRKQDEHHRRGQWLTEIEALALVCASDTQYRKFLDAADEPVAKAVGSAAKVASGGVEAGPEAPAAPAGVVVHEDLIAKSQWFIESFYHLCSCIRGNVMVDIDILPPGESPVYDGPVSVYDFGCGMWEHHDRRGTAKLVSLFDKNLRDRFFRCLGSILFEPSTTYRIIVCVRRETAEIGVVGFSRRNNA